MKITKSQLRQIIKEEVQKELDEGLMTDIFKDTIKSIAAFFTGENQLSADEQNIIKKRSEHWLKEYPNAAGGGKAAEKWAMATAMSEFRAGELDNQGNIKGPEKKADPGYLKDLGLPKTWSDFADESPKMDPIRKRVMRAGNQRDGTFDAERYK